MPIVAIPIDTSIQTAIDGSAAGTIFHLAPGIYRGAQFTAKAGDAFVGDPSGKTVLSGAIVLHRWVKVGNYWVEAGVPAPHREAAVPGSAAPASQVNDLFVDDTYYAPVNTLAELKEGRWYYNHKDNTAYLTIDPTSRRVEYSLTPNLTYDNGATGVVVRNLTVEKYASKAQTGAVDGVRNWRLEDVTIAHNHGAGLNIGSGTVVLRGHYSDNGQIGINGWHADEAQIQDADIAGNNYAGYNRDWEAGGVKLGASRRVAITGNTVHGNSGNGVWGDLDDHDWTITRNRVADNDGDGIIYEISHGKTVISDNDIVCNRGSGVYISNSDGVEVSANRITVAPGNAPGINGSAGSGGIDIINDRRGSGPDGLYEAVNNDVHNNIIAHPSDTGEEGLFEFQPFTSHDAPNIHFDFNTYLLGRGETPHWHFDDRSYTWASLRAETGFEKHGTMTVTASPLPSGCGMSKHDTSTNIQPIKPVQNGPALLHRLMRLLRSTSMPPKVASVR
jgi:hypothetical protein